MGDHIEFIGGDRITVEEYASFFHARQPHVRLDMQAVERMLELSILVTARRNGQLVGFTRIVSDECVFSAVAEVRSLPEFYDDQEFCKRLFSLTGELAPTRILFGSHRVNAEMMQEIGWEEGVLSWVFKQKPRAASFP